MSKEYNAYLQEHKNNVVAAYYWLKDNLPELLTGSYDDEVQITANHDQSKTDTDEYMAYDNYFNGNDQSYYVKQEYNRAWLNHIHRNPHHWQYWILTNDDPNEGEVILDMPYNYILEMICDWWSFSFKQNKLDDMFVWYNNHKIYMKLSDNTRRQVEYILGEINKKLI